MKEPLLEAQVDHAADEIRDVGRLTLNRAGNRGRRVVAERDAAKRADGRNLVDVGESEIQRGVWSGSRTLFEVLEEFDGAVVVAAGDHSLSIVGGNLEVLRIGRDA